MLEKSCLEFLEELSSSKPIPGGGGACAYAGAIGIALGSMVGNLTTGKQNYANVQDQIAALLEKSAALMKRMAHLVDKDAEVFLPLSRAYSMVAGTEEEKKQKEDTMQKALLTAASVPLEIASCCLDALKLLEKYSVIGNRFVISDAGTGAALCKGALQGAKLNVIVNLKLMKDQEAKELMSHRLDIILQDGLRLADEIYIRVEAALR